MVSGDAQVPRGCRSGIAEFACQGRIGQVDHVFTALGYRDLQEHLLGQRVQRAVVAHPIRVGDQVGVHVESIFGADFDPVVIECKSRIQSGLGGSKEIGYRGQAHLQGRGQVGTLIAFLDDPCSAFVLA